MKIGTVLGATIGMAVGVAAVSVLYPDVYRRMMRDGKRTLKKAEKAMNKCC
ncbi:MAG: hypothetical protein IJO93_03050 [Clostridia bacterium]|nr:hypothetical protein [Clostridia bacterium]